MTICCWVNIYGCHILNVLKLSKTSRFVHNLMHRCQINFCQLSEGNLVQWHDQITMYEMVEISFMQYYFSNYSQSNTTYLNLCDSLWLCLKALTRTACMQNANGLVLYLLTWWPPQSNVPGDINSGPFDNNGTFNLSLSQTHEWHFPASVPIHKQRGTNHSEAEFN